MKGLVLQANKKYAYVVNEDGMFVKIINRGYKVGQEILIPFHEGIYESNSLSLKTVVSLAAVFVLVFALTATGYCFFTPFSYVTIDINPSLELSVNYFDMVISINPLNDDAKHLVENKEKLLRYRNVSSAAEKIIDEAVSQGYFKEQQDNPVLVGVVADNSNRAEVIANEVSVKIKDRFDKNNIKGEVLPFKADKKQREEAKELHLSAGKLALIKQLENKVLIEKNEKDIKIAGESKKNQAESNFGSKIQNSIDNVKNKAQINNSKNNVKDNITGKISNKIENTIEENNKNKIRQGEENKSNILQSKKTHKDKQTDKEANKETGEKANEGAYKAKRKETEKQTGKETQRENIKAKKSEDVIREKSEDLAHMPVRELVKKLKNKQ